ncbi:uncharacterized protein [Misgurnus anguillicaudatus]|uniref:uncharacterized protein isoform X3 n=1 Tax=Misgurnus anguillicaudatus TaxID=75329 RepID=UPI003CCF1CE1
MDMDNYVLFHGSKRVTLREDDMWVEKISRIFQVITDSLYLTDDRNVAIFPNAEGSFSSLDLTFRAHYEVHGDSLETSTNSPATSAFASVPGQRRFSFTRPAQSASATTAHACRTWTRAINVAEVQDRKPVPKSVVMVRFSESEADVPGIVQKLQVDLRATEPPVLLDANWN